MVDKNVLYFTISACIMIAIALIMLIGIIRVNQEKKRQIESDEDDPNERADNDIVYVRAGLNKQVKMTWGQYINEWKSMDRGQRRIFMRRLVPEKNDK